MDTLIIREQNSTLQVFVGEHAARLAASWALNEILSEYTWDDGQLITDTHLRTPEDRERVFAQIGKQGLRDPQEIQVLQRMLVRIHRGQHVQAVRALAPLRSNFEVEVAHCAHVHTQVLLLSGSGVMDLYGSKEITFTRLDHRLLLRDVHRELLQLALEHDPKLFLKPDFQQWRTLVEAGQHQQAHQHFKTSSVHRLLDVGFEESWEVLRTHRAEQLHDWQQTQPSMRAHGPTLFTAAQALLSGNTEHLEVVPEALRLQAERALKLHQQYEALQQAHLATPEEQQDHHRFDQEACQISLELTRTHLIPELLRLDPALDQVFFAQTGDHLLDVLPELHFQGGDSGGYTDLEAKHKSVFVNLTDSQPSYPRLFDVGISLMPEGAGQEYQVVVMGTTLHLNTSGSLNALLKRPAPTPITTLQLLATLRDERRPLQVTPWLKGQRGTPLTLEHQALTQRILQHPPAPEGDAGTGVPASETTTFTEKEFQACFSSVEGWEIG